MNRIPFLLLCLSLFFSLLSADNLKQYSLSSPDLNDAPIQPKGTTGHGSNDDPTVAKLYSSEKKASMKDGKEEDSKSGGAQHQNVVTKAYETQQSNAAVKDHSKEEPVKTTPKEVQSKQKEISKEAQENKEGSKASDQKIENKQVENKASELQKKGLKEAVEIPVKPIQLPKSETPEEKTNKASDEGQNLPLKEDKQKIQVVQQEEKEDIKIIPAEKKKAKTTNSSNTTKVDQSTKEIEKQPKVKQESNVSVKKVQKAEDSEKKVMTKPPVMPIPNGPQNNETKLPTKDTLPKPSEDNKINTSQGSRHDEPKRQESKLSDFKIISLQSDKQPLEKIEGQASKINQPQGHQQGGKGQEKPVKSQEKSESHLTKDTSTVQAKESDKRVKDNLSKEEKIELLINQVMGTQPLSSQSKSQIIKILQASKKLQKKDEHEVQYQTKLTKTAEPMLKLQQVSQPAPKQDESDKKFLESKQMSSATIMVIIVLTFLISIPIFRQIRTHNTEPSPKQPESAQTIGQSISREYDSVENEPSADFGQSLDEEFN